MGRERVSFDTALQAADRSRAFGAFSDWDPTNRLSAIRILLCGVWWRLAGIPEATAGDLVRSEPLERDIDMWGRARSHMQRAHAALRVTPAPERARRFKDLFGADELELAIGELEQLGHEQLATRRFWASLADAAREMRLENVEARLRQRTA